MTSFVTFSDFVTLDDPFATAAGGTTAEGVNASGEIVGSYVDASGHTNGFTYTDGAYQTVDDPNGDDSTSLTGISNSGEIVGVSGEGAFYYKDNEFSLVSANSSLGQFTSFSGVNDLGEIVGSSEDIEFHQPPSGFIYDDGVYTDVATDVGGINNEGQVAAEEVFQGEPTSAFIYQLSGPAQTITVPAVANSNASFDGFTGINDLDQIVGNFYLSSTNGSEGFLDENGTITLINDPSAALDGKGTVVTGINDSGQVVGYYYDAAGDAHGFVANFTPGNLVISGTVAGQQIANLQTDTPFSHVSITDANGPTTVDAVAISLSDAANGTLSNLGSGFYDATTGVYTVSGSAAAVTAALDGLVFTPTVAVGSYATTIFTISVDDGLSPTVTDSATSVTAGSTLGGGQTVSISGAPGYSASLYDTADDWDTVSGDDGTVFLTSAQASVVGHDDSIMVAGGSGNEVSLYRTANGWDTVSGSDEVVYLSDAQASIFGGDDSVYLPGSSGNQVSLYDTAEHWDGVSGSDATIFLTNAQASITGGDDAVYLLSGAAAASLYGTAGNWDRVIGSDATVYFTDAQASVFGGGDTLNLQGTTGNSVSLYDTAGNDDTVSGLDGTIYLTDAQAFVTGGDDSIYLLGSSGNQVSLYDTAEHRDGVSGSDATIFLTNTQASITGGDDAVYLLTDTAQASLYGTAGNWDRVIGSDATVYFTDAQASVFGGGDTLNLLGNSGNAVSLYNTGTNQDIVTGSDATLYFTAAKASVFGGGDTLNMLGPLNIFGTTDDFTSLFNTVGDWDTVNGSNSVAYFVSAQASVFGGNDTLEFYNRVGNAVSLYGTDDHWDTVDGSGGAVTLNDAQASVNGGDDYIYFNASGDAASLYNTRPYATSFDDMVYGGGGAVTLNDAQASATGDNYYFYFNGVNQLDMSGGSEILTFQPAIGAQTISGFNATDTLQFSASDFANFAALQAHLTQSGTNAVITLDANDSVTLTNVTASSLTASEFRFA